MAEKIRVMLTSCGGWVIPGMVECLRSEPDYDFHIVGVDVNRRAVGAHFVNSFHVVPEGVNPEYPHAILDLARKESIQVIVPLSDEEVLQLSRHRQLFALHGVTVLCSDFQSVQTASNKAALLTFLKEKGIAAPAFYNPRSLQEMDQAVEALGYPHQDVVLKPTHARGARGFWIVTEKPRLTDLLLKQRHLQQLPYSIIRNMLQDAAVWPSIVVMQYLRGHDFNVDALCRDGETLYCMPMRRLAPSAGPVQEGLIVHDSAIEEMVRQVIKAFGFNYNINVELAYPDESNTGQPLIYEINPRVSGPIAACSRAGINLLLLGILLGLSRDIPRHLQYRDLLMQRCWQEIYPASTDTFCQSEQSASGGVAILG